MRLVFLGFDVVSGPVVNQKKSNGSCHAFDSVNVFLREAASGMLGNSEQQKCHGLAPEESTDPLELFAPGLAASSSYLTVGTFSNCLINHNS